MAETQFETVDIQGEIKIGNTVYTPQDRIVPKSIATQLVERKMAVIIRPSDSLQAVETKMEKAALAHEKSVAQTDKSTQ